MAITYRRMRARDWPGITDLAHDQWEFDLNTSPEGRRLAADVDVRVLLRESPHGFVAVDEEDDGRVIGMCTCSGPKPLDRRIQGHHEVALAKALEAAEQIDEQTGEQMRGFEREMREFRQRSAAKRTRDYDGEITMFLVDPAYRGKGIGRELFRMSKDWLRDQGCRWVFLDTDDDQNYRFYDRDGWTRTVEFPEKLTLFGKEYTNTSMVYEKDLTAED